LGEVSEDEPLPKKSRCRIDTGEVCGWQTRDRETLPSRTRKRDRASARRNSPCETQYCINISELPKKYVRWLTPTASAGDKARFRGASTRVGSLFRLMVWVGAARKHDHLSDHPERADHRGRLPGLVGDRKMPTAPNSKSRSPEQRTAPAIVTAVAGSRSAAPNYHNGCAGRAATA